MLGMVSKYPSGRNDTLIARMSGKEVKNVQGRTCMSSDVKVGAEKRGNESAGQVGNVDRIHKRWKVYQTSKGGGRKCRERNQKKK